jgi:hypothetical protein
MKFKISALVVLISTASGLLAAPLSQTTAVHVQPDALAPVVTYLKAGSEPTVSLETVANTPAGWMAVELQGPFEAYVLNKDLTKALDVVPGASLTLEPKAGAGILTKSVASDKATITGLYGKWTQIRLDRKLVGYIAVSAIPGYMPPIATTPASTDDRAAALSPPPATAVAYGSGAAGRAAPMVNLGDGGASSLPRQFSGRFVSTRRPFTPRRPHDWALNDDAGRRYAFLDVSKLLLTEQIEKYLDRAVIVYGTAKNTSDGKDLLIEIESLQLK